MLFARSVLGGEGLLGEVRRNLAAYSGQPQLTFPRDAIQALYVAGNGENAVLREKLQETLGIPVYAIDPFAKEEQVQVDAANRAGFIGAVGLLDLWSVDQTTPANFVKPRKSKPAANPHKRRALVYGMPVFWSRWCWRPAMAGNRRQGSDLLEWRRATKTDVEAQLKVLDPEIKYLEALKPWREAAIPWLDELYDLAAAPMDKNHMGFRIKKVDMTALEIKKPATGQAAAGKPVKEFQATAKITINGVIDTSKSKDDSKSISAGFVAQNQQR